MLEIENKSQVIGLQGDLIKSFDARLDYESL